LNDQSFSTEKSPQSPVQAGVLAVQSLCILPVKAHKLWLISSATGLPQKGWLQLSGKLGHQALLVKANLGTDDGLDHLFSEVENTSALLDIIICNVASGYNRPALQQKPRGWDWTMNINARSLLFAT
jgi:NAD(P)-dependent dehydrogenase (short-subunit alcohol dehydrogenase family)